MSARSGLTPRQCRHRATRPGAFGEGSRETHALVAERARSQSPGHGLGLKSWARQDSSIAYLTEVVQKLAAGWAHRRLDEFLPLIWTAARILGTCGLDSG